MLSLESSACEGGEAQASLLLPSRRHWRTAVFALFGLAVALLAESTAYAADAAGKRKSPSITTQPQSQSVAVGNNATFTVAATGSAPLSYKWQFNGTAMSGATNTRLTVTNAQPANAGSYAAVVTNTAGSATSAVAVLTVLVPPAITVQPQSQTNVVGSTATFSATASGSAPLEYRWQQNGLSLTDGGRISGAASSALTLSGVQTTDAGTYTLVASNPAGSVTSAVATLTVNGPPGIAVQPVSQTVMAGSSATFTVTATGTPPLSYQWSKDGTKLADGGNVAGATGTALTMASVQTNDAGSFQVVITNSAGIVTSAVASLVVTLPLPPGAQNAGVVVLVNSLSARYLDFQHFIQPYLDNFGFPYAVVDISTNPPGPEIGNCAVMVIGHSQLDTNRTYLTTAVQANLSSAVYGGSGLVNFDNDLSSGEAARYQFVQDIFGFSYGSSASGSSVSLPPTEPASQMHYITARHPTNDLIGFRSSITLPGITVPGGATTLAVSGGKPLVAVTKYGQGRAVQWGSYSWMVSTVLGPVDGLDDVVWRGVVWAARKPFVMRGLPNFVTMRLDDAYGPFGWLHAANEVGFKPFVALFYLLVSDTSAADLQALTTSGMATASIHSLDYGSAFFYFNHATEEPWPDNVQSNNFYLGTQWHTNHGIPISKICATHYSEIGLGCFAELKAWGMEYVPIEVVPEAIEYATPGAPWLVGGPYRLYETPQPGQVDWPTYYADWLSVPGHPEFDGQFFNIYSEVRDASSCDEWCPDNDVAGSANRATRIAKRALDSMVLATIFSHEWYISSVSTANWQAILQGVTNNLVSYNPSYVTLDYACQYVRATRTSRLVASSYDSASGQVAAVFSGKTDLATSVYVFDGADSSITSSFGNVPAFTGSVTNIVATISGRPVSPAIINPPTSVTTNAGATVAFSVTAVGTAPLSYQWLRDNAPLADGGKTSGACGSMLTLTGVTGTDAGSYTVVVTNLAGSATSSVATLTVVLTPYFTSIALLPDGNPVLSLAVVPNLTYRIDAATDWVNWIALTNIVAPSGELQFVDLGSTNWSQRFYRAVWVP